MSELTYRITEKGRAEVAAGSSALSPSVRKLVEAVGQGSTFAEIWTTVPQVEEGKLRELLEKLVAGGFLAAALPDLTASDLDIARYFNRAVIEPTINQRQHAEQQTMVGMPALERSGYLVNIMSRPGKPIPPNSGDKHTALIIDPDEPSTMVMARTLVLAGFDTRSAAKRHEIVAQLNRQPPVDVIAMDVALPDVIGLELLGRLRAHPIYKAVPIVVMASNVEHDDIVAALAYGASGYMSKPFRPEALLDGIKAVLGLG